MNFTNFKRSFLLLLAPALFCISLAQAQINNYQQASANDILSGTPSTCIATGTYVGDGSANKIISGLSFSPDVVLVKVLDNSNEAQIRTSSMGAGYSKQMVGATSQYTNRIKELTSDGFVVGSNNDVNAVGKNYYWSAFDASSVMEVGTYIGDGTTKRIVGGFGFNPDMVWIFPGSGLRSSWKSRTFGNATTAAFGSDFGLTNIITDLVTGGFEIGSSDRCNRSGDEYNYVVFKEDTKFMSLGSYLGNGINLSSFNNIELPGFSVQYLMIKAAAGIAAIQKSVLMPSTATVEFLGSRLDANRITYIGDEGFTVNGYFTQVNRNNTVYHYAAFNACQPAFVQPTPASSPIGELNIFPNPAKDVLTIQYNSDEKRSGTILLMDQNGRNLVKSSLRLNKGLNSQAVYISDFPAGLYLIKLITANGVNTKKLVIVK